MLNDDFSTILNPQIALQKLLAMQTTKNVFIIIWFSCPCLRNLWDHQLKKLPFGFLSLRYGDITILCWYTFVLNSLIMLIYVWYPWLDKDLKGNPLLLSRLILSADFIQVGIGLLALQQLSGVNGVLFYSSNIFKSAGQFRSLIIC